MWPSGDDASLSGMDPTGRFSDRAGDYVQYRPDYPPGAIETILDGLGDPADLTAADVGAGTGISARLLADRGVRVIAIEPNAGMRHGAVPHAGVEWRDGTAEATGLATASVGLVVCAQSFHWFRGRAAAAEFHRVLEPGGRLALMWNVRDTSDPATLGYIEAIHAVYGVHPAESRAFSYDDVVGDGYFSAPELMVFPHSQRLDLEGLIGRATSASYVSKDPASLAELTRRLTDVHRRHAGADGHVTLRYATDVFRAGRR
jgi:SAM-dependent methyltransferase